MTDKHPTPWTVVFDDNNQGWIKSVSGEHLVGFDADDKDFWEGIVATVNGREALFAEIEQLRAERDVLKAKLEVEERYLHSLIEDAGGVMHGDIEGVFHRIRDEGENK